MNENLLQLILEYQMTKEEAFAFRLTILYMEMARKYFPDYKHATLPKKGDPRKGLLFKYCWKLMQDTKDKLQPEEYRHYIQAQMSILQSIKRGDEHPYIDPNCLVGNQAWARWCIWSKYFTEMKKTSVVVQEEAPSDFTKETQRMLQETHYALTVRLGELTKDKVLAEMPNILRWVRMSVVSPYFVACSPTAQEYIHQNKPKLGFVVPPSDGVEECYKKLFKDV